ncbi:unnamed protein product [Adineta ricciae]|uniref:Uncharacterized protein n=1 Tax=Adineta ricciae TaxID=249248 RepID=A0A813YW85_ADIRI|nr:unnamed protein product [Adineta ricciae]
MARIGSSKNKTGLYAAPALVENQAPALAKTTHNRPTRPAKLLLALSEQKHHHSEQSRLSKQEFIQHYATDENQDATTSAQSARSVLRNGFRPSPIRRQKQRGATTVSHRDISQELSPRQTFTRSPGSARLKSEIEHITSKIKLHEDSARTSRLQQNRDAAATPFSAISSFVSRGPSSASTSSVQPHQQFSSTTKNGPTNTMISIPTTINEDNNRPYVNYHVAHAYQIPQQSTIGSESAFPSTSLSTVIRKRATKTNARNSTERYISCPFYVMHLTNLTLQQEINQNENEKKSSSPTASATPTPRKGTATTTRIGTSLSRLTSNRRQVASPITIFSRSTMEDDDDNVINIAPYYNSKRFSAKMTAFEHENSHLLKDVLRTTAWNHVQM